MSTIGFLIIVFLIGSIPFGLLISRYWLKIDIREKGSGNIGMTNVMRVGGKLPGILTFLLDFSKGSIAVLWAQNWFYNPDSEIQTDLIWVSVAGIVAVCGHVFSVFLRFKGGKGISTLFGVLAILNLPTGLVAAAVWVGMFLWKRISSLSAMCMLTSLPFISLFFSWFQNDVMNWPRFGLFAFLSLLLIYKHKENIERLLTGQEGQLNSK